jgi:hypothetical protein
MMGGGEVRFGLPPFPGLAITKALPMGKFTEKDAEIFRREARDCRDQADKASDPADREGWLKLAEEWAKLAKVAPLISARHRAKARRYHRRDFSLIKLPTRSMTWLNGGR